VNPLWALLPRSLPQAVPAPRKHTLRVLDMTGLLDDGVEQGPGTMRMWDCTAAVARTCIAQHQGGSAEPGLTPVPVEVRVDLRVNRAPYAFLREPLRSSVDSPLRLCCRDLRAEDLPMRNTVALLQPLDAGCLHHVDLRFNNLGLRGLSVVIPHVARFQHLASPLCMVRTASAISWPRWVVSPVYRSSAWALLSFLAGWTGCSGEWAPPLFCPSPLWDPPLGLPVCDPCVSAAPCRAPWRAWSWPVLCCLSTYASWHGAPNAAHLKKLDLMNGNDQPAPFQGLLQVQSHTAAS
jgi:hypothetical protein